MFSIGRCFKGLLFTGAMLTPQGPKVIEYGARFGDPETQSSMLLISPSTDFAAILLSCTNGTLAEAQLHLKILPGFACNVIIASGAYPSTYEVGEAIALKPAAGDTFIFHAGTSMSHDGVLRSAGGRVFSIAAYGNTFEEAVRKGYEGVNCVEFEPMFYRKDIASRCLTR
jgi:phosphoribosylamine--glycine ligase/phosphoribosylformylglycinamidine cyclo-ligase